LEKTYLLKSVGIQEC
jgi:hypothetical protein